MTMRRFLLAVLTLLAGTALSRPAEAKKGLGFELYGGWGQYEMGVVNDSLASLDQTLGTDLGAIESGALAGGAFRFRVHDRALIRVGVERWFAASHDRDLTFDLAAWALVVNATYMFPSTSAVGYGLGLGVAPFSVLGAFKGDGFEFEASGSGFGAQLFGEVTWSMGGPWSLNGMAGYRFAKSDLMKLGEQAFAAEPDYSGPWLRLGVAIDGQ